LVGGTTDAMGAAQAFVSTKDGTWVAQGSAKPPNASGFSQFVSALSADAMVLAVGDSSDDSNGGVNDHSFSGAGAVYVYE
jgi:hypothetical protein